MTWMPVPAARRLPESLVISTSRDETETEKQHASMPEIPAAPVVDGIGKVSGTSKEMMPSLGRGFARVRSSVTLEVAPEVG
eukprot:scaffold1070_cov245-Pinguiococcus_pyrenoidosus.AAC.6